MQSGESSKSYSFSNCRNFYFFLLFSFSYLPFLLHPFLPLLLIPIPFFSSSFFFTKITSSTNFWDPIWFAYRCESSYTNNCHYCQIILVILVTTYFGSRWITTKMSPSTFLNLLVNVILACFSSKIKFYSIYFFFGRKRGCNCLE
jgi:hypothetical protein